MVENPPEKLSLKQLFKEKPMKGHSLAKFNQII